MRQLLDEKGAAEHAAELIGRFGVGFYSAFMVADRVTLRTRRAGSAMGVEWESAGDGTYTLRDYETAERGTSITLYLKAPDPENGIFDFTDDWRLSGIIKKHSDFITYPIILRKEKQKDEDSEEVTTEE